MNIYKQEFNVINWSEIRDALKKLDIEEIQSGHAYYATPDIRVCFEGSVHFDKLELVKNLYLKHLPASTLASALNIMLSLMRTNNIAFVNFDE